MSPLDFYLDRKADVLAQRREDFAASPAAAVVSLRAHSKVAGSTGARPTRMGEFSIVSDSSPGLAGHALGPTAPEMLLGALASCLVHTYLIQAVLLNISLSHVEVEVTGEVDMRGVVGLPYDQPPQIANIAYQATLDAAAAPEQIAAMHAAVEATCPVLNTLRLPVTVRRT